MKPIIIYGPTSTGKTALGLQLAKLHNGEIISADSRQVYKGLDIGSGKVGFDDKAVKGRGYWEVNGIKIYGYDLCSVEKSFTAADFINSSIVSLEKIKSKKKLPIIVGGTGFYIKVLLDGLESYGIPTNKKLRTKLNKLTKEQLKVKLKEIDIKKFSSMNPSDKNNPRRLVRAIEISLAAKTKKGLEPIITDAHLIGLTASNSYLYKKSDTWLETRLNQGLLEEIESLLKNKVDPMWLEKLGLEYRWVTLCLTGKLSFEEAIAGLKGDSHDFIRRQKNWFRKFKGIKVYDIEDENYLKRLEKDLQL